ncbi:MAG: hypothetical protein SVM80_11740 [Halobacteriota archaeon]|nr:hypothetical protein [Halobacteriota archaeon]
MSEKAEISIIGAKFRRRDAELIREVARLRGGSVSDFLRYAVLKELARLSYLSEDEEKALGVRGDEHG